MRSNWITNGIKKSCLHKRKLYLNIKTEDDRKSYKYYTKMLGRVIDRSKRIQNHKYISQAENRTQATWNIINCKQYKQPTESIKELKYNNDIINNPYDIANLFNDKFVDMVDIHNESNMKHTSSDNVIDSKGIVKNPNSIFVNPITPEGVKKLIKNLKNKKSVGYDYISTKVIKYCSNELAGPLSHIINLSISNGVFPKKLKLTVVKPLYKKGTKDNYENYRPIALISVIAKIFESYINETLYSFFEKYNVFREEQFGFRKDRSTSLTIYHLMRMVSECLNDGMPVISIFMDMSKAFDFVCHKRLLHKLHLYGIRGPIYDLIASYLSDRQQYTEIAYIDDQKTHMHTKSRLRSVKHGVPQGSILGPLLFLIYINDLPQCVDHQMFLFADDSTLIIKGPNKDTFEESANNALKNVIVWMQANHLVINLEKTKYMQFHLTNTRRQNITVQYEGNTIERVEQIRFLGVVLDSRVGWGPHTNSISQKIYKFVFPLRKLAQSVSKKAALAAYHGYVASNLRYGLTLWGNAAEISFLPVFRAQKKCIRAMCGVNQMQSCRPLFVHLKVLSLPSMYIYHTSIFVKSNQNYFKLRVTKHHRKTRNKVDIVPHHPSRTTFFSNSIYVIGPKIYNHLPDDLKQMTRKHFQRKLFDILLRKCYYSLQEFFEDKITIKAEQC